jgi:signal transduction histidine kinase
MSEEVMELSTDLLPNRGFNQFYSQVLAKVGHEVRKPLNAILGFSQLLNRTGSLSEEQGKYLQLINRSGELLLTLFNSILPFAKLDAGTISLMEKRVQDTPPLHGGAAVLPDSGSGREVGFACLHFVNLVELLKNLEEVFRFSQQLYLQNEYLKQHNQQLVREIRERQQAEKALEVFLHTVSHDLRNPVIGWSMALQSFLAQNKSEYIFDRQLLETLWQSCSRQQKLIDSLVKARPLKSETITLSQQPISLFQLGQNFLKEWQPIFEAYNTQIDNKIQANLPLVNADAVQLWRVLENLVGNAIKYNKPGLTIALDAIDEGEQIRFIVTDNGVGIPHEQIAQLFEPYTRGAKASKKTELGADLGLGLYICQQIIEAHRGEIGVENHLEKGAKFWFTLPLDRRFNQS